VPLFWAISCFLLLLRASVERGAEAQQQDGDQQTCSRGDADAYMECVRDNPCLCSNCDPDPLDDTPEIVVDTPPQDCRDVNRIFCPLIRCCSACEDAARSWYGCTFASFSLQTLGEECPTTCEGYDYADVEGDCQPSAAPDPPAPSPEAEAEASSAPSDVPSQSPGAPGGGFAPTGTNSSGTSPTGTSPSATRAPASSGGSARSGELALALCAALVLAQR
jgi:hypothetical protein